MKIVLLTLSGDSAHAREQLRARYAGATIESVGRERLEQASPGRRVKMLRSMGPAIFAVATERLVWQRGQNAFLLLGALAGAQRAILLDAHGGWREESRAETLLKAPARLAREAVVSAAAMRRAETELRRLERAVEENQHRGIERRQANPDALKLVYLRSSPGPGTQAGGAASHIKGFLEATLQLGAHATMVSNDEIAGLNEIEIPLKVIWPKPFGSTRAAFDIYNNLHFTERAIAEIEQEQPDFIYQRYARFSWAGVAAAIRTGRPLFLEYNGSEVWVGRFWDRVGKLDLLARYERLNLQTATRIFVVSEVERQNLLAAGVAAEKIIVNPNGVDADRFRPGAGGAEWRHKHGITQDETLVAFVGTFGPWHGVEVLAEAITRIPREARVRFLLIGSGALRDRVDQILREEKVTDRVMMLGAVAHERVPRLLDACDVLVSPHVPLEDGSDFFGSPTKLFEYMAMGKAIVASRLGQIGEVLAHEKTALLVEPGNVQQLADGIMHLVESRELRENLGRSARQQAVERHTWKHNAKRVIDTYAGLSK